MLDRRNLMLLRAALIQLLNAVEDALSLERSIPPARLRRAQGRRLMEVDIEG